MLEGLWGNNTDKEGVAGGHVNAQAFSLLMFMFFKDTEIIIDPFPFKTDMALTRVKGGHLNCVCHQARAAKIIV